MNPLGFKDRLGYDFEIGIREVLFEHGLHKFMTFANPTNPYAWKRRIGNGVDLVLKVDNHTYYIELSYCGKPYHYRKAWFEKCRIPRFNKYPHDKFHQWILVTNRPNNFSSVKTTARSNRIHIWDIDQLLYRISRQIRSAARFLFSNSLVKTVCNNARLSNWIGISDGGMKHGTTLTKQNNVYAHGKAITRKDAINNTPAQYILALIMQTKKNEPN